jgi:hypothetical protein
MTGLAFDQCLSVGQVNKAAMFEPSQISIRIAGPMSADGLVRSEFDNLLPFVSERIECGGDKRLVTVMLQVRDFADIAFTVLTCAWHQFPQKRRRAHEKLTAIPARIKQSPARDDLKIPKPAEPEPNR